MTPALLLASSSIFRRQQLSRLGLAFECASPNCDEHPLANESAADTAIRLAENKARALAVSYPQHLIIGADQVAWCNQRQLGKPMNLENAKTMLMQLSGKQIDFYSAVCLLNPTQNRIHRHVDHTIVQMRSLSESQIEHYLERESDAIYCAGAAKSEGLGAALIERIDSSDPNALIGLPIFRLMDFLALEGIHPL